MYVLKNVYSKNVSKCYAFTTNALRFLKNAFSYEYNLIKLIDCTVFIILQCYGPTGINCPRTYF